MLDIIEVRSIFDETVREACVKGLIDSDFGEVAMSGVESGEVDVDYGSFTNEAFREWYPDVFERLPVGMAPNAVYDPITKTVILNSDVLKEKETIIYSYKMAIIHEMRHY